MTDKTEGAKTADQLAMELFMEMMAAPVKAKPAKQVAKPAHVHAWQAKADQPKEIKPFSAADYQWPIVGTNTVIMEMTTPAGKVLEAYVAKYQVIRQKPGTGIMAKAYEDCTEEVFCNTAGVEECSVVVVKVQCKLEVPYA